MRKEDCFQLGHISRLHGIKGEVVAVFDTDKPESYKNLESILVDIHHELVPFFIEEITTNSKGHFILKLEDISSKEAQSLINRELFLPLNLLPALSGKSFYFHEVIDFSVFDQNKIQLGKCLRILENAAQPLFLIAGLNGEEILVPAVDDFIIEIDRSESKIHLHIPEGLLDLYQNEN